MALALPLLIHTLLITLTSSREIRTMLIQKNTPRNEFGIFKHHPSSNFSRFVEYTGLFVDNSLLIKQIYDEEATVVIFHCPRAFGKTLNLKMIKAFYELEFEPESVVNITSNMGLFRNGQYAFNGQYKIFGRPLLISNYINFMNQYQGQIPVINLKMTSVSFSNVTNFQELFSEAIRQTFLDHEYLLDWYGNIYDNPNTTVSRKEEVHQIRTNFTKFLNKKASLEELKSSINFLAKVLADFSKRYSMLLLDDYDFPLIISFYSDKIHKTERQQLITFFKDFMRLTVEEGYIEKAIFTGIFEFAQEIMFEGCTVTKSVHNFLTDDSYEFFGISRFIADKMFDYIRIPMHERYKGVDWYGGYRLGKTLEIFHPHAVVQFKRYRLCKNYFKVSFYPHIFFLHLLEHKLLREIVNGTLIQGGNVTMPGNQLMFNRKEFYQIYDIYRNPKEKRLQKQHLPIVYSYLLATGYLTFINQYDVHELPYAENIDLKVPNKMVQNQLRDHLRSIPQNYS